MASASTQRHNKIFSVPQTKRIIRKNEVFPKLWITISLGMKKSQVNYALQDDAMRVLKITKINVPRTSFYAFQFKNYF